MVGGCFSFWLIYTHTHIYISICIYIIYRSQSNNNDRINNSKKKSHYEGRVLAQRPQKHSEFILKNRCFDAENPWLAVAALTTNTTMRDVGLPITSLYKYIHSKYCYCLPYLQQSSVLAYCRTTDIFVLFQYFITISFVFKPVDGSIDRWKVGLNSLRCLSPAPKNYPYAHTHTHTHTHVKEA